MKIHPNQYREEANYLHPCMTEYNGLPTHVLGKIEVSVLMSNAD